MSYSISYSVKSGLGTPAIEVYLYGCDKPNKCRHCHNDELWDEPNYKREILNARKSLLDKIEYASNFVTNLKVCFLGGEPTTDYNKEDLLWLAGSVKSFYPNIPTVIYSWKRIDKWSMKIPNIDYGVLGEYDHELHVDNQIPSSSNQIIYDFNNDIELEVIKLRQKNTL